VKRDEASQAGNGPSERALSAVKPSIRDVAKGARRVGVHVRIHGHTSRCTAALQCWLEAKCNLGAQVVIPGLSK
jgi:hypothetical protein